MAYRDKSYRRALGCDRSSVEAVEREVFRCMVFSSPALERRQFVFVLLFPPANKPLLQETLGQASAPHAECDCQAEHQSSEGNSEGHQHGLFCETQFFKDDGQYDKYDDAAD